MRISKTEAQTEFCSSTQTADEVYLIDLRYKRRDKYATLLATKGLKPGWQKRQVNSSDKMGAFERNPWEILTTFPEGWRKNQNGPPPGAEQTDIVKIAIKMGSRQVTSQNVRQRIRFFNFEKNSNITNVRTVET